MKNRLFPKTFVAVVGVTALTLSVLPVTAENSYSVSPTVTTGQTAPQLSYGAANVLKLAQAKVGEETIIAYIEKSGQSYGSLGASEIIYLRDQGVTDRVLTTMLTQTKKMRDDAIAQSAAQQTVAATTPVPAPPVVTAPQYQQTYAPPPVTYVQTAPAPLIVMRDSSPRLVDYGIYPRHYSYGCYPNYSYRNYGYRYPTASFSVGFGGRHGGFGFSRGFRGGYCR